jgi:trk system potassium uptake protein TrkA
MKIVIMGCGRVGAQLASLLDADGHQITVLDIDAHSFRRLPPSFGGTALVGDGTVMAAQIAKHIFNVRKVLCRIYDPLRKDVYEALGLEAVSPTTVFAQLLRDKLLAD